MTLLLTAQEAAEVTGYKTAARFKRAVKRCVMPAAADPGARPQLWSRAEIEARLTPDFKSDHTDPRLAALEKRWGMR